jgi:hypothetical protein
MESSDVTAPVGDAAAARCAASIAGAKPGAAVFPALPAEFDAPTLRPGSIFIDANSQLLLFPID